MATTSWKETRPGRFERPLSHLEKIALINRNVNKALDRDNWAKTAVAKLEFDPKLGDPEAALKIAWKQVRFNYPEIAAFPYQDSYMYRIGNPDQVSLWVTATFSVVKNTTVDELLGHIPRNEQMMCYYLPDTSEVLVRSPHYRLDARGAIFCLDYLIESLANLNWELVFGGCAKNLSPSIDEALQISYDITPSAEQAATKRIELLKPHNPALLMTPTLAANLPGATRRHFIKMSRGETRSVIRGSSSSSKDLTAAVHAALITSVAKICSPSTLHSFLASYHADLRHIIKKTSKTKHAPTSCTSVITAEIDISPSTSFETYYAQLAPVYAEGYTPYLESTVAYHEKLGAMFGPPKSPKSTFSSSSRSSSSGSEAAFDGDAQPRYGPLGVIDHQLRKTNSNGTVTVKDFWLGGETLTKRKIVHMWMWDGEMVFSCCFNESFWDSKIVNQLLEGMKRTLLDEFVLVNGVAGLRV